MRLLRRRRSVAVRRFDASTGRWVDTDAAAAVDRDELTVATFNIWFDDYHAEQRHRAIADLLRERRPDVIVLQEVTAAAFELFAGQPWIRDEYLSVSAVGGDTGNYGMLMLSRVPVARAAYTRLPTRQSRGFLDADLGVTRRPAYRLLSAPRQRQVLGAAARVAVTQDFPRDEEGR